jgi:hypothetical protein
MFTFAAMRVRMTMRPRSPKARSALRAMDSSAWLIWVASTYSLGRLGSL